VKSMLGRMCRDEGGASKAGVLLVVGLLLLLLVGAVEVGGLRLGTRAPGVLSSGSVAARQRDSYHRSFVAARGAYQPSERPGLLGRQRAGMATDARNDPEAAGAWQVPEPSATATPAWGRQIGGLVYETLPQVIWKVLRALGEGVKRILG
jgi:hypothetical protein